MSMKRKALGKSLLCHHAGAHFRDLAHAETRAIGSSTRDIARPRKLDGAARLDVASVERHAG
jgi:hypothetical protein